MRVRPGCFILVLGAALFRASAAPAQPGGADATACAACHKEIVNNFAGNPHGRPDLVHDGKTVTCENCHGPGKAHAENGAVSLIFSPARASASEVNKRCQECHGAKDSHFEHSAHGKGNASCIGCHVIHVAGESQHLLRMEQPALCYECHGEVKPQFSAPVHHKVQEGLINCTDCHDPHGAPGEESLPSATVQFMVCTKCHVPVAGPFLYEHAAVKAEGCSACHAPHGGSNPNLLIEANVNTICLRCHLPAAHSETGGPAVPEHIQEANSESCVKCHVSIHGSNVSAMFARSTQGKQQAAESPIEP